MGKKRKAPPRRQATPTQPDRSAVTALVLAGVVLVVGCVYIMPFFPDDTYISFRYAQHLAEGHGLTFNVGVPLEAYSNFLWILVLAGLYKTGMSLVALTPWVGVLFSLGGLGILYVLLRRRVAHGRELFLPLAIYASAFPLILYTVSGMETALFALLLLAMVLCVDNVFRAPSTRAWIVLGVTGTLVSLARPEGVVVLPLTLGFVAWQTRRSESRTAMWRGGGIVLAGFVVLYGLYTAWRAAYFGDLIPTPFVSKGYEAFSIFTAWKKNAVSYFVNGSYLEAPTGYLFVTLIALSLAGVLRGERPRPAERFSLLLGLAMAAIYLNFVDWMPGMRYDSALVGLFVLPIAALQRYLPSEWWERGRGDRALAVAVALLVLMGASGLSRVKTVSRIMTQSREECLIPLGEWIRSAVPPRSLIAIGDVGAVPYYSGMPTLDIHRHSLTDARIAKNGFTSDYVIGRQPVVVCLNARGVYSAKMDPLHYAMYHSGAFTTQYNFIGTVRHRWYLDRSYWVFVHESVPLSMQALRDFPVGVGNQQNLGFDRAKVGR